MKTNNELAINANGSLAKRVGINGAGTRTRIEELTARVREEQQAEVAPRIAHRRALEDAIHQTLAHYQEFIRTVDLADYKAFSRVLTAAIMIAPPEFLEEAIKLRERVDHFVLAVEESMKNR